MALRNLRDVAKRVPVSGEIDSREIISWDMGPRGVAIGRFTLVDVGQFDHYEAGVNGERKMVTKAVPSYFIIPEKGSAYSLGSVGSPFDLSCAINGMGRLVFRSEQQVGVSVGYDGRAHREKRTAYQLHEIAQASREHRGLI